MFKTGRRKIYVKKKKEETMKNDDGVYTIRTSVNLCMRIIL